MYSVNLKIDVIDSDFTEILKRIRSSYATLWCNVASVLTDERCESFHKVVLYDYTDKFYYALSLTGLLSGLQRVIDEATDLRFINIQEGIVTLNLASIDKNVAETILQYALFEEIRHI